MRGEMFIGSRCRHGHLGLRYKSNRICVECQDVKQARKCNLAALSKKRRLQYNECLAFGPSEPEAPQRTRLLASRKRQKAVIKRNPQPINPIYTVIFFV
jgi:hypothetical protein